MSEPWRYSSGLENGRDWAETARISVVHNEVEKWFPPPKRTEPLAVISRRLAKEVSRQLGRRCTIRLRHRGLIEICDRTDGLRYAFDWITEQPDDSPVNQKLLASAIRHIPEAKAWFAKHGAEE